MIYFIGPYKTNYKPATIREVVSWAKNKKVIGIDTETRRKGLSSLKYDPYDTEIIMFQIGDLYDQFVIDTRYVDISPLFKILTSKSILKVQHNIKYDYSVIYTNYKIRLENVFDTMVIDYVINNGKDDITHSLENCCIRYLGNNPYDNQLSLFDPWITKQERVAISKKVFEDFEDSEIFYGATDIISALRVKNAQDMLIKKEGIQKVVNLENRFVLVLGDMELTGLPLDTDMWLENERINLEEREKLLQELKEVADINWDSPKQVVEVFKSKNIKVSVVDKKTGKEKDSVQATTMPLENKSIPLVINYTRYKEYSKYTSSYGNKFLKYINPVTGRIHTSFMQIMHTGRISSSSPNLQNIPREIEFRQCFKPGIGKVFIVCDYSKQETAVLAEKSGEQILIDALNNDVDTHTLTASLAYGIKFEDVTKDQRQLGKSIAFLIAYGGGAGKLSKQFGIPMSAATRLINNYYKNYKNVKKYFDILHKYVLSGTPNIIIDAKLKRKFYLPDHDLFLHSRKFNIPEDALVALYKRTIQNYSIQSPSAGMSKLAGIYLRREKLKNNIFDIVLMKHDEWVLECEENYAEECKAILENCMQRAAHYYCKNAVIRCVAKISNKC